LNHFTVPLAMEITPPLTTHERVRKALKREPDSL
jgi:hypothetical protein